MLERRDFLREGGSDGTGEGGEEEEREGIPQLPTLD